MKSALEYKQQGNESLQNSEYYEAIHHYETAMSIFHWIVNKKDNWKRQEIEDDMLEMFEYCPETGQELNEVHELKCSCLLNIALASQKLQQWSEWYCISFVSCYLPDIASKHAPLYWKLIQTRLKLIIAELKFVSRLFSCI